MAQTLAQRTQCYLLLGQPDKALRELTLMHDSCRILQKPPTGKPETLVEAMINVAISGVYVSTVADGFRLHGWQEPQLAALQQQLADINLTPFVFEALQEGPAALCRDAQIAWIPKLFDTTIHAAWTTRIAWWFWPSGWTYQNMVNVAVLEQKPLEGFDLADDTVSPRKFDEWYHYLDDDFFRHNSPFKLLAAIAIPNFSKAEQTTAYNQTLVNEAQIACALERYHLANGEYPETLDALMPQFMEKIPHDIIGVRLRKAPARQASHCIIAARTMENFCSTPSAGMKRMMAEKNHPIINTAESRITPTATGSGKIRAD